MTSDVITEREALDRIDILTRETNLQRETIDAVLDWNRQWQEIAREWAEKFRRQLNENIRLRNELTAPTMGRIQNGLAKAEAVEKIADCRR